MINDELDKEELRRKLDEIVWKQKNQARWTTFIINLLAFGIFSFGGLSYGPLYLHSYDFLYTGVVPIVGWLITIILHGVLVWRGSRAMPLEPEEARILKISLRRLHVRVFAISFIVWFFSIILTWMQYLNNPTHYVAGVWWSLPLTWGAFGLGFWGYPYSPTWETLRKISGGCSYNV